MKVVIAVDSFKGSATSLEVANGLEKGIQSVVDCDIIKVGLADGGEGTLDALKIVENIKIHSVKVCDPLLRKIEAEIGELDDGIFIVEMAQASGITKLSESELNPYLTSSYGTGELIKHCLEKGAHKIYIGIGGSATNDCGIGMMQALGMKFYNKSSQEVKVQGQSIMDIVDFDISSSDQRLQNVEIVILSDVTNPLCGENGASAIYGPQKGLSKDDIYDFDHAFESFAELIKEKLKKDYKNTPGAGAAGGVGFSFLSFFDSEIKSGIGEILKLIHFEDYVNNSYLIITGEGKVDDQSLQGKAISGILEYGNQYHVPVILVCGKVETTPKGFSGIYPIMDGTVTKESTMKEVVTHLYRLGVSITNEHLVKDVRR